MIWDLFRIMAVWGEIQGIVLYARLACRARGGNPTPNCTFRNPRFRRGGPKFQFSDVQV